MEKNALERTRLVSVWGLSFLSLAILSLTRELELHTLAALLALIPAALLLENKRPLPKRVWIQNAMILALFSASIFRFFATQTAFLLIVADFLVSFLLLKMLFPKDHEDLLQMIALSFFVLLSAATLALDITFLAGFLIYVPAAAWTLTLHSLCEPEPSRQTAQAESADASTLFRFARRNSWITLALVGFFSTLIFLFFPRLSLAVFQGAFLNPAHESGFTESVNLQKSGSIQESSNLVMRVGIAPDQRKKAEKGYLRGQTLGSFNGTGWSANREKEPGGGGKRTFFQKLIQNRFQIAGPSRESLKKDFGMELDPEESYLEQDIYLESTGRTILFGMPWMETLEAKVSELNVSEDFTVRRPRGMTGRFHYKVKSLIEKPSEASLIRRSRETDGAETEGGGPLKDYLQLPDKPYDAVRNLVSQIVSRRDSPYAKARKIEQYLNRNYQYTLELELQDPENPVESFLFKDKRGECEYFASAMAVMLRLEGIPSRIASGFVLQEWNANGNYYVVRAKDAHAWVEANVGGLWIPFDPSPRLGAADLKDLSFWDTTKQRLEYWNFLWTAYVLGYDMESQKELAYNAALKSTQLSASFERVVDKWRNRLWGRRNNPRKEIKSEQERAPKEGPKTGARALAAAAKILTAGTLLAGSFWVFWRLRKRRNSAASGSEIEFYFRMLKALETKGWRKKSSETPREFCERLRRESPEFSRLEPPVQALCSLFYEARFNQKIPDQTLVSMAQADLTSILKQRVPE